MAPEIQLGAGQAHTCARIDSRVRCWGSESFGALGYGNRNNIGDNETPASAGYVDVGGAVQQIAVGGSHTCALLDGGGVRCWGEGSRLGYGVVNGIGDDELPSSAGYVSIGGAVRRIAAGNEHTCVVLSNGPVRCWGFGFYGALGYGNSNNIGDNEVPASAGDVNLGGAAVEEITVGGLHTCALIKNGPVRCWGKATGLGYGNTLHIGDNETPASAGEVNVGGAVRQLAAGMDFTCALLTSGSVRCWGLGNYGQLGHGNTSTIGDDETPASAGDVNVGGPVQRLAAGFNHVCALLSSGAIRCWGHGQFGQLGYGNVNNIGDNEAPASAGDVNVGGPARQIVAGLSHTCALLTTGAVRCWGHGEGGRLGYANTNNIGDDETPASAGDVPFL